MIKEINVDKNKKNQFGCKNIKKKLYEQNKKKILNIKVAGQVKHMKKLQLRL